MRSIVACSVIFLLAVPHLCAAELTPLVEAADSCSQVRHVTKVAPRLPRKGGAGGWIPQTLEVIAGSTGLRRFLARAERPSCRLLGTSSSSEICMLTAHTATYAAEAVAKPQVEAEDVVFAYTPADNGAGPMWCHGSTCIVRVGERVFASGIETIPGAKPLNNCLPLLFERTASGWELVRKDEGRTREPCPLAVSYAGKVFLSINPTLTPPDTYGGRAEPRILEFDAASAKNAPAVHVPKWGGAPEFSEHSYRSFAADGERGELILFQNIGYDYAHWAFRDAQGAWPATGKIVWPWGAEYDKPQRIRICYPAVALKNRAVHICGVSDIIEPYNKWREYKKKLTGRDWDYDFRRLFYASCEDIGKGVFRDWIEVASRDKTCGWIFPQDIHVGAGGRVLVMWTERAIDERMRKDFFPGAKQRHALELAVIRNGAVEKRATLVEGGEELGRERPGDGRFHETEDGRLFVFCFVGGADKEGKPLAEHRLIEIGADGTPGPAVTVKLKQPLSGFFNATVRAGCRPSNVIDILGEHGGTMRYARIRLK